MPLKFHKRIIIWRRGIKEKQSIILLFKGAEAEKIREPVPFRVQNPVEAQKGVHNHGRLVQYCGHGMD